MNNLEIVEELRNITKERIKIKDRYEKCCNNPDIDIITKGIMLNNFDIAYSSLEYARDRLLMYYMEGKI